MTDVAADESPALVEGTGWIVERHLVDDGGTDHAVALRKAGKPVSRA